MNLKDAVPRLYGNDAFDAVLDYLRAERDAALHDFQDPDLLDNPQKLARLAGEIAALDRTLKNLDPEHAPEAAPPPA